jgi:crotonobetainyl-CoA:carnitine CoA-transferase CaiB-like acyl-CoA transferase
VRVLSERLRSRPSKEWIGVLESAGVPCGPVNDVADAFEDSQVTAREGIDEYEHPDLGRVRTPGPAVRVGPVRPALGRAPYRGEHTRTVLRDLCGYTDAELDRLARDGVFGDVGA